MVGSQNIAHLVPAVEICGPLLISYGLASPPWLMYIQGPPQFVFGLFYERFSPENPDMAYSRNEQALSYDADIVECQTGCISEVGGLRHTIARIVESHSDRLFK